MGKRFKQLKSDVLHLGVAHILRTGMEVKGKAFRPLGLQPWPATSAPATCGPPTATVAQTLPVLKVQLCSFTQRPTLA
jgi:hypothetical protein